MASTRNFQITLTTTNKLIAQQQGERSALIIRNDSGSTVYIGIDSTDTISTAVSLATGAARSWYGELGDNMNRPWYGLVSSGTATIGVEESFGARD
jgi:hypothetical protein